MIADVELAVDRWPIFAAHARAAGYRGVHALPMRLRSDVIGTLKPVQHQGGALADTYRPGSARPSPDVATIAILQERAIRHQEMPRTSSFSTPSPAGYVIEQAKGVLAERGGLDMDEAFERLRRRARDTNTRLTDVAHGVVEGRLDSRAVLAARPALGKPGPPP